MTDKNIALIALILLVLAVVVLQGEKNEKKQPKPWPQDPWPDTPGSGGGGTTPPDIPSGRASPEPIPIDVDGGFVNTFDELINSDVTESDAIIEVTPKFDRRDRWEYIDASSGDPLTDGPLVHYKGLWTRGNWNKDPPADVPSSNTKLYLTKTLRDLENHRSIPVRKFPTYYITYTPRLNPNEKHSLFFSDEYVEQFFNVSSIPIIAPTGTPEHPIGRGGASSCDEDNI